MPKFFAAIGYEPDEQRRLADLAATAFGPSAAVLHADGVVIVARANPAERNVPLWFDNRHVTSGAAQGFVCVADARLDNLDELVSQLAGSAPPPGSEAEVIAMAYAKWGRDAPSHLLGDFAFLVIEPTGQCFAATDALGVRTLTYRCDGHRIAIGSRAAVSEVIRPKSTEVNDGLLRRYVQGDTEGWATGCTNRGVARSAPGTSLAWQAGITKLNRYHRWGEQPGTMPATDQDIVAEFRQLLVASVKARLPQRGTCGVFVSGGVDSSSVLGACGRLQVEAASAARVFGITSVYQRTDESDERAFVEAVGRLWSGISITAIVCDDVPFFDAEEFPPGVEVGPPILRGLTTSRLRAASAGGASVILSGSLADQLLGSYSGVELWAGLSGVERLRELGAYKRASGGWTRFLLRVARHSVGVGGHRLGPGDLVGPHLPRHGWRRARLLHSGLVQHVLRALEELADAGGLEWRFPFLDQRVVEFLLRVRTGVLNRHGTRKWLLRESMAAELPEEVRTRQRSSTGNMLAYRSLQSDAATLVNWSTDSHAVRRGWLTDRDLERRLDLMRTGSTWGQLVPTLRWANAELWLRSTFGHG